MCCLFGFHDYGHRLTRKQRSLLLTTLSVACEERGTDATGIAYNEQGIQHIYKRPIPARRMWFRIPLEATAVMGHTRMTTQGSALRNQNNHPFRGRAGNTVFALAHNGVLHNDKYLRKIKKLPVTPIETDSYVAAQLLEQAKEVSFSSLRDMAELLDGTFTLTVLTHRDELYFIKGNNPMCIYHFPELGLYVYASTEDILRNALRQLPFLSGRAEKVHLFSGEIVCIHGNGRISRDCFDDSNLYSGFSPITYSWPGSRIYDFFGEDEDYLADLKAVAASHGLFPEDVDELLRDGVTPEEIEEYLYCG